VKVKHARMDISVAEAGLYLTQADRFAVRPCSLMMAGAGAAVVVADTSVDDSFQRLTITGTLRDGLRAQGARRLVVANSFISGWSGSGVVLEQTSAARLFYTTIVGPLSGPGDGVRLRDATGTTALNNVNWTRGGDSAACFRVDGVWPFTPGGVDHNDLFAPNGSIARVNDTLVRTLTEWRALGASPDPASISRDPQLVSDTSHRILETSPCRDSGVPVPGFETDLDGDERDPATPDIGADEYTAPGVAEWPAARPGPVLSADNPVGRTARLRYVLAEAAEVRVRLVDVAGRAVCAVEAGVQRPGLREFRLDVGRLTTGVYLCRLDAGALKGAVKLVKR
jgi:hypothetical protein